METASEAHNRRLHAEMFVVAVVIILSGTVLYEASTQPHQGNPTPMPTTSIEQSLGANPGGQAAQALSTLAVKGRAPKTGYARTQFGHGWTETNGCDTRDDILRRDLSQQQLDSRGCKVLSGVLNDPYTGKTIQFKRGAGTSSLVQIDHVVALGDSWQTGAQQLSALTRIRLANDPLELLAVDGRANDQKSDSDAASWLPIKASRCMYVARQIAVKEEYNLWVTQPEHDAMAAVLTTCPGETLPTS